MRLRLRERLFIFGVAVLAPRGDDEWVSSNWREEVAVHLVAAASDLRARRDGSFVKSCTVAIGYLEQAARSGISRNAERVWQHVCKSVKEGEHTAQMKLTPEAMEEIARRYKLAAGFAVDQLRRG